MSFNKPASRLVEATAARRVANRGLTVLYRILQPSGDILSQTPEEDDVAGNKPSASVEDRTRDHTLTRQTRHRHAADQDSNRRLRTHASKTINTFTDNNIQRLELKRPLAEFASATAICIQDDEFSISGPTTVEVPDDQINR